MTKGKVRGCYVDGLGILGELGACFNRQIGGNGIVLKADRELSLAGSQIIDAQKSADAPSPRYARERATLVLLGS